MGTEGDPHSAGSSAPAINIASLDTIARTAATSARRQVRGAPVCSQQTMP